MNGVDVLDGLELHDHFALHDQIGAIADIDGQLVIGHGHGDVFVDMETALSKLVDQASMVDALEKPRSEAAMDLDGTLDDHAGQSVDLCGRQWDTGGGIGWQGREVW